MKYFFDNCISFRFARMLAALDVDAVALRDVFDQSVRDVDFLASLRGPRTVYVTYDRKQQTRVAEARAIREAGVTAIWFGPFWGKKEFWEQAVWLVARWPRIDGFVRGVAEGTCAEIKENGKATPFTL